MEMNLFTMNQSEGSCARCGDQKNLNRYGVCDQCNVEIDDEYMEIYNIQNMEC